MDLMQVLHNRYATKKFNPHKHISAEDITKLKNLLQLSASSTNIQPWHFIFATSQEGKDRIAKSTEKNFIFNVPKIKDASAAVVFASKTELSEEYLVHIMQQEDKDGRLPDEETKQSTYNARKKFSYFHQYDFRDWQHWAEKQVYINLGFFLLGAASLGIDTVAIEGFDFKILDEEFKLREKGFTSAVIVSLGYRADDDLNASLPKSRLPQEEIIEMI